MTYTGCAPMDTGKGNAKGGKSGKGKAVMTEQDVINEQVHVELQDLRSQVRVLQAACM